MGKEERLNRRQIKVTQRLIELIDSQIGEHVIEIRKNRDKIKELRRQIDEIEADSQRRSGEIDVLIEKKLEETHDLNQLLNPRNEND